MALSSISSVGCASIVLARRQLGSDVGEYFSSLLELYPHIDHPGISNVFRFKISSYTYFLNRVYGRGMDVVSLSVKRDKNTIAKFIGRNDEVNAPIDELLFLLDVEGLSEYLGGVENISKNRILSNAIKIRSFDY